MNIAKNYKDLLISKGLKITPQRLAVLDAVINLKTHPTADNIIQYINSHHSKIAVGTVYRTLDTFTEKGLVSKIKTETDVVRYDAVLTKHHHLFCNSTKRIEDYYDGKLDELITNYFIKKKIPGFLIKNVKLQIKGEFTGKT